MSRLQHWPRLLDQYVDAARARQFEWGTHDCVTFAAGAVRAITGRDVGLPAWGSALQAERALQALGGLRAAVTSRMGPAMEPAHAQRGDVLLLQQEGRDVLAVCMGHVWAAPGADGVVFGPAAEAVAAWRVN